MKKESYESSMKFINYFVENIEFKNNLNFEEGEVSIDFDVSPEFLKGDDERDLIVVLDVSVFKDAVQHNYPFEMNVRMVGFFRVEDENNEVDKFKPNAVAIMYPYIRAIVTNYTANANVNPLILPVININALIRDKMKNKEE